MKENLQSRNRGLLIFFQIRCQIILISKFYYQFRTGICSEIVRLKSTLRVCRTYFPGIRVLHRIQERRIIRIIGSHTNEVIYLRPTSVIKYICNRAAVSQHKAGSK